jgi:hypothetical protein
MTVYDLNGSRQRAAARRAGRARATRRERELRAAEQLVADLRALVGAGVLEPVTDPAGAVRYALADEDEPGGGGGAAA